MQLMDALMPFPAILLAIAVAATLGASVGNVIIALAVASTPYTSRVVRASVLVVRELEFVEAARSIGATETWILRSCVSLTFSPSLCRLRPLSLTSLAARDSSRSRPRRSAPGVAAISRGVFFRTPERA